MESEPSDAPLLPAQKSPDTNSPEASALLAADSASGAPEPESRTQVAPPLQFSLTSLLLTTTLVCVCLGAGAVSPLLGIGVTIVSAPAFLRTAMHARRLQRRGIVMDVVECLATFWGSCGVVLGMLIAVIATFYGTCWAGFATLLIPATLTRNGDVLLGPALVFGLLTGAVVAGALAVWLVRRYWAIDSSADSARRDATP